MSPDERRFAERYVVTPRGCHVWTGGFRRGEGQDYPTFRADGRAIYARTYAWETTLGPVTPGKRLVTVCGDRRCVNPLHLREGDATDAAALRAARGNYVVRRGARRRVSLGEAAYMRHLREHGYSIAEIARTTGYCVRTAQYVLSGHRGVTTEVTP